MVSPPRSQRAWGGVPAKCEKGVTAARLVQAEGTTARVCLRVPVLSWG